MESLVARAPWTGVSGDRSGRSRLEARLDELRSRCSMVWVWGLPGSGKTTLVSRYVAARRLRCLWCTLEETRRSFPDLIRKLWTLKRRLDSSDDPSVSKAELFELEPADAPGALAGRIHPEEGAREYFKQWCRGLPRPICVVLDGAELLGNSAAFETWLLEAARHRAEGIELIVLGRDAPPPRLEDLGRCGLLETLDDQDLRLLPSETLDLVHATLGQSQEAGEWAAAIQRRTGGWAAGVGLLVDALARSGSNDGLRVGSSVAPEPSFGAAVRTLLTAEGRATRYFALRTACLPWLTPGVIEAVCGSEALAVAAELVIRGYLLRLPGSPRYLYPSLVLAAIRAEAQRALSELERASLVRRAALGELSRGDVESAITLLQDSGDAEAVQRVIVAEAHSLAQSGRSALLWEWLEWVATHVAVMDPECSLWLARSRIASVPRLAQKPAEAAFLGFEHRRDRAGMLLAWATLLEAHLDGNDSPSELDTWLDRFDPTQALELVDDPDTLADIAAAAILSLWQRRPADPLLERWVDCASTLLQRLHNPAKAARLVTALLWQLEWSGSPRGILPLTQRLIDMAESSRQPQFTGWASLADATACRHRGAPADALDGVQSALDGSTVREELTVRLRIEGALCSLAAGNPSETDAHLQGLERTLNMARHAPGAVLPYLVAWRHLADDDLEGAAYHAAQALASSRKRGDLPWQALAHALLAVVALERGAWDEAESHLRCATRDCGTAPGWRLSLSVAAAEAQMALDGPGSTGEDAHKLAENSLCAMVAIAREHGMVSLGLLPIRRATASRLLGEALRLKVGTEYVRGLIRAQGLETSPPRLDLEAWPWRVRVFTLGRFSLTVEDRPLRFGTKAQKRPVELLKALIALGGRDVSEERLASALWPDSEGDAADRSLAVTLHRLRQLLGDERTLLRRGRALTLDATRVWVDVWAFERGFARAQDLVMAGRPQELESRLSLYRGAFLADEPAPWTTLMRERLRSKYLRSARQLSEFWQAAAGWERAAEPYLRALDVEPLAEEPYLRLMDLYDRQGRPVDARAVARRMRASIEAAGWEAPSSQVVVTRPRMKSA